MRKIDKKNTLAIIEPLENDDNKSIKPFEELKPSTITYMIFSNVMFDAKILFNHIKVADIEAPLTKKKKNVDKKKLKTDYGSIISVKLGIYYRGVRMSKTKKFWCPLCQLYTSENKEILTVSSGHDIFVSQEERDSFNPPLPKFTKKIRFKCSECGKFLQPKQLRKIVIFLNQFNVVVSLGSINIDVMMFDSKLELEGTKLKLAGNKTRENAMECLMILWENYIRHIPNSYSLLKNETRPQFLFELVMGNVEFRLGFAINKIKVHNLLDKSEYSDYVTEINLLPTNVNIKLRLQTPKDFKYEILSYDDCLEGCNPKLLYSTEKLYCTKKKKISDPTIIIFSTSETILSGRFFENMKDIYEFFVQVMIDNSDKIQERINVPTISLMEHLKNIK